MSKTIEEMEIFLGLKKDEINALEGMDKYQTIIEWGNDLESFPENKKTEPNKVHGCVSDVYIEVTEQNNEIHIIGCSSSHIVKGYLALLIEALNGLNPYELLHQTDKPIQDFIDQTDMKATLTPSRANAFGNIFTLIKQKVKALVAE